MCKPCSMSGGVGLAVLFYCAAVTFSGPVFGQSIFSEIFGFAIKAKPSTVHRQSTHKPGPGANNGRDKARTGRRSRRKQKLYRTFCVRTCDGFYYPISHSTARHNIYRDGEYCQSQCAGETRLFYTPASNVDIEQAIDVSGLRYPSMSNAFVYRKRFVKACTCRAKPWSAEERARHLMYRLIAAREARKRALKRTRQQREATVLAVYSDTGGLQHADEQANEAGRSPLTPSRDDARAGAPAGVIDGGEMHSYLDLRQSHRVPLDGRLKRPGAPAAARVRKPALRRRWLGRHNGVTGNRPAYLWPGD